MYKFLQPGLALLALAAAGALRGQITESPVTVRPGSFLLEVDALSLSVDREPGLKYTGFAAATTFLTTGLTARLDLQLGAEFFISQEFDAAGLVERRSGVGDLYVRTKWRFYESEDTYTAVAVMSFVKIPTNSGGVGNDAVEGGVIVPMETMLVGGFTFAAMGQVDLRRNDNDDGYDSHWHASASLTRSLTSALGFYAEATVQKSTGGAPWAGMLGAGALLHVSSHMWWDFAIYRGVSRGAADWASAVRFNWSL